MNMISLSEFAIVKNYKAGVDGNRIVFYDKNLRIAVVEGKRKNTYISPMIVTAYIDDPIEQDRLSKLCDEKTTVESVIVVNEDFIYQPNKVQLALLAAQNIKTDTSVSKDVYVMEVETVMEIIAAVQTSGKFWARIALNRRDKAMKSQGLKLAGIYKKLLKKGEADIYFNKPNQSYEEVDDEEETEDDATEEENTTESSEENEEQKDETYDDTKDDKTTSGAGPQPAGA